MGPPSEKSSIVAMWIATVGTILALSVFVALLTRLKFRRIKEQNNQFRKIKILTSNFELEIEPEFADIIKA